MMGSSLRPRSCPPSHRDGFSLIEVVLAVAIVAFSILAILGVLSVGMRSSREASEDTVLALTARQVAAWARAVPFAELAALADDDEPRILFFNEKGFLQRDADGAPATRAAPGLYYQCAVSVRRSPVSADLLQLSYRFEWPMNAAASVRQHRLLVTSRSR